MRSQQSILIGKARKEEQIPNRGIKSDEVEYKSFYKKFIVESQYANRELLMGESLYMYNRQKSSIVFAIFCLAAIFLVLTGFYMMTINTAEFMISGYQEIFADDDPVTRELTTQNLLDQINDHFYESKSYYIDRLTDENNEFITNFETLKTSKEKFITEFTDDLNSFVAGFCDVLNINGPSGTRWTFLSKIKDLVRNEHSGLQSYSYSIEKATELGTADFCGELEDVDDDILSKWGSSNDHNGTSSNYAPGRPRDIFTTEEYYRCSDRVERILDELSTYDTNMYELPSVNEAIDGLEAMFNADYWEELQTVCNEHAVELNGLDFDIEFYVEMAITKTNEAINQQLNALKNLIDFDFITVQNFKVNTISMLNSVFQQNIDDNKTFAVFDLVTIIYAVLWIICIKSQYKLRIVFLLAYLSFMVFFSFSFVVNFSNVMEINRIFTQTAPYSQFTGGMISNDYLDKTVHETIERTVADGLDNIKVHTVLERCSKNRTIGSLDEDLLKFKIDKHVIGILEILQDSAGSGGLEFDSNFFRFIEYFCVDFAALDKLKLAEMIHTLESANELSSILNQPEMLLFYENFRYRSSYSHHLDRTVKAYEKFHSDISFAKNVSEIVESVYEKSSKVNENNEVYLPPATKMILDEIEDILHELSTNFDKFVTLDFAPCGFIYEPIIEILYSLRTQLGLHGTLLEFMFNSFLFMLMLISLIMCHTNWGTSLNKDKLLNLIKKEEDDKKKARKLANKLQNK